MSEVPKSQFSIVCPGYDPLSTLVKCGRVDRRIMPQECAWRGAVIGSPYGVASPSAEAVRTEVPSGLNQRRLQSRRGYMHGVKACCVLGQFP